MRVGGPLRFHFHGAPPFVVIREMTGLADDTLVIFTSDNGPEQYAYRRIPEFGHYSMGELRGVKRDAWEGGHRVPFLARWPGRIRAGGTNPETICLTDLTATCGRCHRKTSLDVCRIEAGRETTYWCPGCGGAIVALVPAAAASQASAPEPPPGYLLGTFIVRAAVDIECPGALLPKS